MKSILSAVIILLTLVLKLQAQLPFVYSAENTGVGCDVPTPPEPANLSNYPLLPDPFSWSDGSGRVENFEEWECRRNEIKAEIEAYEIGPKPDKPESVTATFEDNVLTVTITENGQTLTLTSSVVMPEGAGPFPVVIGMNNPTGSLPAELFEGVIQIPFRHDQVVTYSQTSNRNLDDPYYDLYPDLTYVGNYSAWAWGVSRLIDGLEIVQSAANADLAHIAVTGCSYAGKMALFSGAFDERIALTIVQESGGGGINSWRVSETIGEVEKIDNTNYAWFMESMRTNFAGKVGTLPHDHHELMAMVVPRAMLVLGNPPFVWLGDESGYVSSRAAQEVYKRFEIEDRFGFSFRSGHNHCQLPQESYSEVQAFVDKFLFEDETANTDIQVHEFPNVDYNYWIEAWKTPADPNTPSISISGVEDGQVFESPASVTIEATVTDPNDDLEKVEFYDGQVKLGEDDEAPYVLSLEDLGPGSHNISAEAVDAQDLRGFSNILSFSVKAPTMEVFNLGTAPVIDGAIDDVWEDDQVQIINATQVLVGEGSSADDLSGRASMLWDEGYFYLLAMVTDDQKLNDSPNTYEDDNVEFYFDANNSKANAYDANDVQYSFAWNDGSTVGVLPAGRSSAGIEYVVADTDNGYLVEARIPWTTLSGTPSDGMEVGFDFMVNDDDDGGGRDAKLSWNASEDQAWQNASLFGTIRLVDRSPDDPTLAVDALTKVSVYPNPVSGKISIKGIQGVFDYQIMDISGQLLRSGKGQDSVSTDGLMPGMYLLDILKGRSVTSLKFVKE